MKTTGNAIDNKISRLVSHARAMNDFEDSMEAFRALRKEISADLAALDQAPRKEEGGGKPKHSIKIGRFTLHPFANGRYGLYKEDGEGGEFDASKLEKHMEAFYDREL